MSANLVRRCRPALALVLVLALASGCERSETSSPIEPTVDANAVEPQADDPTLALETLAVWQRTAERTDALAQSADELYEAVLVLLDRPSVESLTQARQHWHQTHDQWLALTPLSALATRHRQAFPELATLVRRIDAQPFEPGYLDGVAGYPYSGLVHDISLPITRDTLLEQHGLTDDSDVSLGFHALAFMLWGENLERPVVDFRARERLSAEQSEMGLTVEEIPNNRRRDLVQLIARQLLDDLRQLNDNELAAHGVATQTYEQLNAATRLLLLASASDDLLRERAPGYLTPSSSYRMGRFGGDERRQLAHILEHLNAAWSTGEAPLLSAIDDDVDTWRDNLEHLVAELRSETLTSDNRARWLDTLDVLAGPFNSQATPDP
ncbi:imelysin family protein [Marinimicrobium alkaliphilum]|uniref:imelysin family protein n=1 Tax=Marinimicrobium alkaliphilum TaxID=2202654 RepID=UPI000DB98DE2|nr:imelysin family protein [Marinimicrobium alkaliphilum]